ncbi:MAG: anaerobic ribonucleoside-triphosphate reductase activating protein [Lachnospiraceae bacterium]|nr:anaerobic ribonucleoside-triphosphate reductase activating protein [Lachnospiraceae bacterium]
MQIHGFNKTTLLDYPGLVAATVFTGGCNFRCPFCQNSDLVLDPMSQPLIPEEDVLSHLAKRKGITAGVCITGGEPTLQPDLRDFIIKLRALGLKVKLDTNGYRPEILGSLLDEGLLDYVAMDIKSSPEGYDKVAGVPIDMERIKESVHLLINGNIPYEFRTTVVRELHGEAEMKGIADLIDGAERYYLQGYEDSDRVMCRGYSAYSKDELEIFLKIFFEKVKHVEIRGVE